MPFKMFFEQEWKRDMGMPNQLDNPTIDKAFNNGNDSEDSNLEPRNADPYAIDNIHAIENHLRSFNRLITRISKSKKFFGMEDELKKSFNKFKEEMGHLINVANQKKIQQPQVNQDVQGIPLNQQVSPETSEKLKGEQPPRNVV